MKPKLVFTQGQWRDAPLHDRGIHLLRTRIYELEQALLRSDTEKTRLRAEMEGVWRERDAARRQTQLLLSERSTLLSQVRRTWVRLGKWLGVPQEPTV